MFYNKVVRHKHRGFIHVRK